MLPRFLLSGSDYGERKILMWDANMPYIEDPGFFPHMIFWTPNGTIRKILLHAREPKPSFWLDQTQMGLVTDDSMIDLWEGEVSDEEDNEDTDVDEEGEDQSQDSEAEEEEKKEKEKGLNSYKKDDVRELNGVQLQVYGKNARGDEIELSEYFPGGGLYICISVCSSFSPCEEGAGFVYPALLICLLFILFFLCVCFCSF